MISHKLITATLFGCLLFPTIAVSDQQEDKSSNSANIVNQSLTPTTQADSVSKDSKTPNQPAHQNYGLALKALAKGDRDSAIDYFKKELAEDPAFFSVYLLLIKTYLGFNDTPTTPPQKSPKPKNKLVESSDYYEEALDYLEKNDRSSAIIQLRNAIQVDPKNLAAYILLAQTLVSIGEPAFAETIIKQALDNGANIKVVAISLGTAYLEQAKYRELLDTISTLGMSRDLKNQTNIILSKAHFGLTQYEKAEEILDDILRISTDYGPAFIEKARIRLIENNLDAAREALDNVPDAYVGDADKWFLRGELALRENNPETAINHFSKALKIDPRFIDALHSRANLWLNLGEFEQASHDIQIIEVEYPRDLRGLLLKAVWASKVGDTKAMQQAIETAEPIIDQLNPLLLQENTYNLLLLATISQFQGEYSKATGYLSNYLEKKPDQPQAIRMLGEIHLKMGQPLQALKYFSQIEHTYSEDPFFDLLKGDANMLLSRFNTAQKLFFSASEKVPSSKKDIKLQIKNKAALALFAAGATDTAISLLEEMALTEGDEKAKISLVTLYLKTQLYDKALSVTDGMLKDEKDDPSLFHLQGQAWMGLNNRTNAINSFKKAIAAAPNFVPARLELATIEMANDKRQKAKKYLKEVMFIDRRNTVALARLAKISIIEGKKREAIELLQKSIGIKAEVSPGLLLVDLLREENRMQEAMKELRRLGVEFPENLEVIAKEANLHLNANNLSAAKLTYQRMRSVATDLKSIPWLVTIAEKQLAVSDKDAATKTLQVAEEHAPNHPLLITKQAEWALAGGNYQQAYDIAIQLIEQNPKNPSGYLTAGQAAFELGQIDKAVDWYAKGLSQSAGNSVLAVSLYNLQKQTESPQIAIANLEKWVSSKTQTDLIALKVLAAGHAFLGNTTQAISLNENIIKIAPNNPFILNNLAVLYMQTGDKRAKSLAQRAYDSNPQSYAILDTLGWILLQEGDSSTALSMLRNAVTIAVDNPEIRYHYAQALKENGKDQAAKRELNKALAGGESFTGIDEAKALYKQLTEDQ